MNYISEFLHFCICMDNLKSAFSLLNSYSRAQILFFSPFVTCVTVLFTDCKMSPLSQMKHEWKLFNAIVYRMKAQ